MSAILAPQHTVNIRFHALPVLAAVSLLALRSASAESPKDPSGPAVTKVELHPATTLLVQPCPVELIFHGDITTTRATAVTYTWVDSRGRTWPQHHRRFSLAGVNGLTHKWKVGKPGRMVDAWVQLKIISPESQLSGKVPVHFTCAK